MLTDRYVWRVYYGVLLGVFCFAYFWATIKGTLVPSVPLSTLFLLLGMTGSEAIIAVINRLPAPSPTAEKIVIQN